MADPDTDKRIEASLKKGESFREIAHRENVSVYQVRKVAGAPKFISELAKHKIKVAAKSYQTATKITELLESAIENLVEEVKNGRVLQSKELRDLAWVAKSQFDQAGVVLGQAVRDDKLNDDEELEHHAKQLIQNLANKMSRDERSEYTVLVEDIEDGEWRPSPDGADSGVSGEGDAGTIREGE